MKRVEFSASVHQCISVFVFFFLAASDAHIASRAALVVFFFLAASEEAGDLRYKVV